MWRHVFYLTAGMIMLCGCAIETVTPPSSPASRTEVPSAPPGSPVDQAQAVRLKRVMVPLIGAMNHPRPLNQVKVGIVDDSDINAASGGKGEFYVTRGLLTRANDQQLMAVLAHEVAHDDLGHVAKAQRLNAGLGIGMILLDQVIPGSGQFTPIAGTLIARSYSRKEEFEADQHGVELLERVGQPKAVMIDTLTWLMRSEGTGGGGFFATHPATEDRIEALRRG